MSGFEHQRNSPINNIKKFFKVKPWNSEECLTGPSTRRGGGDDRQSSLNSSTASLKASPLMIRRDLENCDFIIPKSPTTSKAAGLAGSYNNIHATHAPSPSTLAAHSITPAIASSGGLVVGAIDIKQYLSTEEVQELQEIGTQLRLGEAKFNMLYKCNEEKLRFTLKNVSVLLKPSASVVGCNWVCETVTYLETMNTKKRPVEIHNGEEVTVELKPNDVCDRTLRLTVYDARRRHVKNPIGHVIFPLREARNLDKMNSYAKKLTFYSQPAGFNRGNMGITLSWRDSPQKLDIVVSDVTNLRCPAYGVNGKDFFVKIMIFLLDAKYKTYKSATVCASPDIRIREKFAVPLTPTQLKDSTISFQVFLKTANKKKIVQKITVGRTVIGPYMRHGDRTLSQWEKMLTTNTSEEVDEQHILYL